MIQRENYYGRRIITNAQSPVIHDCNRITTSTVQNIAIFIIGFEHYSTVCL